ncbi:uncharacterized protein [Malus domestica]|uniref:uncharacterized protein isoform X2 n=1 Tax=Malus domestica TaxID=3750 RepID=UPI00397475AD
MGVIHWKFCPSLHYMGVIHWGLLKLPTYAALVEDPEFRKYIDLYAKVLVAEFSYRQGFVANLGIGDYLRRLLCLVRMEIWLFGQRFLLEKAPWTSAQLLKGLAL